MFYDFGKYTGLCTAAIIVSTLLEGCGGGGGNATPPAATPPVEVTTPPSVTQGNGSGKVTSSLGGNTTAAFGYAVAVQNDGKILVSGSAIYLFGFYKVPYGEFALARYHANGSLDNSFGAEGVVTTILEPTGALAEARSITLQADGKILLAGNSALSFALVRYNTDGSLDTSFGAAGKVVTSIGAIDDKAKSVTVQSDGKILVAGYSRISQSMNSYSGNVDFSLVRYNQNGSLDSTFGVAGKVLTDFEYGYNSANSQPAIKAEDIGSSISLQSDGKIIVAGSTENYNKKDFALARYNANGSLDTTFGVAGKVMTAFGEDRYSGGRSAKLQDDGKILVAGFSGLNNAVVRYNIDGSLDKVFGIAGKALISIGSTSPSAGGISLVPLSNGKMVIAATRSNGEFTRQRTVFSLVRLNANGSMDTTFDTDGIVTTDFGSDYNLAESVALQGDGKILVAGSNISADVATFALARYNTDGSLDTSFGVKP